MVVVLVLLLFLVLLLLLLLLVLLHGRRGFQGRVAIGRAAGKVLVPREIIGSTFCCIPLGETCKRQRGIGSRVHIRLCGFHGGANANDRHTRNDFGLLLAFAACEESRAFCLGTGRR
jgi:hypothetical protein